MPSSHGTAQTCFATANTEAECTPCSTRLLAFRDRMYTATWTLMAEDGQLKVPSLLSYGATLLECSLYRRRLLQAWPPRPPHGHVPQSVQQGQYNPKCDLCGGAHLSADKTCKTRYKTLYLVRKRRWEKQQAEQSLPTMKDFPSLEHCPRSRSRSRSRSRCRCQSRSKAQSGSRSTSRKRSGATKTVIQRRGQYGHNVYYFYRNWTEYANGFGDPADEYWI
ncbi:hypothetical protein MTO96_043447, partial [Rhipicephalus appendiculatus]